MQKLFKFRILVIPAFFFALTITACSIVDNTNTRPVFGARATDFVERNFGIENFSPTNKRWKALECKPSREAKEGFTSVELCFADDSYHTALLYLFYTIEGMSDDDFIKEMNSLISKNQIVKYIVLHSLYEKTAQGVDIRIMELYGMFALTYYRPYFSYAIFNRDGYKFAVLVANGKGYQLKNIPVENLHQLREVIDRLRFS